MNAIADTTTVRDCQTLYVVSYEWENPDEGHDSKVLAVFTDREVATGYLFEKANDVEKLGAGEWNEMSFDTWEPGNRHGHYYRIQISEAPFYVL